MDSTDLSKEQCEWLSEQLSEVTRRLRPIYQRMQERKFPNNDRMYRLLHEAYNAALVAWHHAHSLHCHGKMGTTAFLDSLDECGLPKQRSKPTPRPPAPTKPSESNE